MSTTERRAVFSRPEREYKPLEGPRTGWTFVRQGRYFQGNQYIRYDVLARPCKTCAVQFEIQVPRSSTTDRQLGRLRCEAHKNTAVTDQMHAARERRAVQKEEARKTEPPTHPLKGVLSRGYSEGTEEIEDQEQDEGITVPSELDRINRLSAADKKVLLDQLALQVQLGSSKSENRDLQMWSRSVTDALGEAIGDRGGECYGLGLVTRQVAQNSSWSRVEALMNRAGLDKLQLVERQAFYSMFARLLVEYADQTCKFTGAPLSPKLVASMTDRLPGLVDNAFPGYLAAGLLPLVARQMQTTLR